MSHLNINGVDKPLDHIRLNNVRSENLLDTQDAQSGYITAAGEIIDGHANLMYTGYIEIPSGASNVTQSYPSTASLMYSPALCFYDVSKNYISGTAFENSYDKTFPVPNGAKYIRTCFRTTFDWVMLNTGSTAKPYYPYLITKEAWEARDKNDHLLWGRADTFTGTSSISARCYGLPVKSWEIDGNSQQSGTPEQDDPIYPEFVGERTANLFDVNNFIDGGDFYPVGSSSSLVASTNTDILLIPCKPSTYYTVSRSSITKRFMICFTTTANLAAGTPVYNLTGYAGYDPEQAYILTAQSGADSEYLLIYYAKHAGNDSSTAEEISASLASMMVNEGSTALPYEPYGYKLNITSAGQTVPIYLGQVQTLRKIKKYVFTGQENFDIQTVNPYGIVNFRSAVDFFSGRLAGEGDCICSHFRLQSSNISTETEQGFRVIESGRIYFRIFETDISTVTALQTWLSDQYAAGTPVCVWYILAEPETAITNEPLAKIGTYADTLTSEQAGITIPTTDGSTTISVDTALAPSRFEIKVHAKPI